LCPVPMSDVLVEAFHFGRLAKEEDGRGNLLAVGVAEPSRDGTESVDVLAATGFRDTWLFGVGSNDCLRLPGVAKWPKALVERAGGALR
jgi:hypothetical protein